MADEADRAIRKQLVKFIGSGEAHVSLLDALKDFPPALYGKKPPNASHNAWQLLEHIRIAFHDLLEFCKNPKYQAPKWPDDYWPETDAPNSEKAWHASVTALKNDIEEFKKLIHSPDVDLNAEIPWGKDQTILREVLLAGDHTSYHLGQFVMLRQQLGAWKS